MKKSAFFVLAIFFSLAMSQAQNTQRGVCGMSHADQALATDWLLQSIEAAKNMPAHERGAFRYVPVHFHLVGDADGAGKIRETRVLEQLCDLNAAYEPVGIRFYLKAHPSRGLFDYTINHDGVYTTQSNTFLMSGRKHDSAMNIYITNIADSGNPNPIGVVLAYYSTVYDWIVSRKDQINGTGNGTLAHEIGHFFSLRHTFYGYDSNPFDSSDPTWPKAPNFSPDGPPTERMNGSNCSTAADLICDTKPDYNFGIIQNGCSAYNGGALDPNGTLVDPQENNYMGYFQNCNYEFTQGQMDVMNANLNLGTRDYLDNTFQPAAETITSPTDLLTSPVGNPTTQFYDKVDLSWKPVTGATYYLVETDISSQFLTSNVKAYIVTGTSLTVTGLKKSSQYYWRVRPFNEFYTCATARSSNFKTSGLSGSTDIEAVEAWSIQPNPAEGAVAQLFVQSNDSFEANVVVTDAAGKVVFQQNGQRFPAGETSVSIPTGQIANGIYFVSLVNDKARMTKKMVVLK